MQFKEKPNGVTRMSTEFLAKNLLKVTGEVISIEGSIDEWKDNWTTFVTDTGDTIMVNGFSWGYGGEGPRGLFDAAKALGFTQLTREAIAKIPMSSPWKMDKYPLVYKKCPCSSCS